MKLFCKQCGRELSSTKNGSDYCSKHHYQLHKWGHFLDANPRNKFDPNEIRILQDYAEFDTYDQNDSSVNGTYIIDIQDILLVSKYKWCKSSQGYAFCRELNKTLHAFLMESKSGQQVDHVDLNIYNNRRSNLRLCNNSINSSNRHPYNKLGVKGVEQHRNNSFSAYFRKDNKQYHSKCYKTIEEAAFARYILEQLFSSVDLTQHNSKLFEKLSENQKSTIIQDTKEKFHIN